MTKIQISKNDIKALQWIAEQGAMSVAQLNRVIWDGKTTTYARFRVKALYDAGYLAEFPDTYSRALFYRITRKAYNLLCDPSLNLPRAIPPHKLRSTDFFHTSDLTNLRIECENSGKVTEWISSRVLALDPSFPKNRFKHPPPDAIYLTKSGRRMAVEFELRRRSPSRVLSKIRAYIDELMRKDRFVDFVLWIVTTDAQQEAYSLARVSHAQKVLTLDEFQEKFKI